jgi:vesicle-fusing ATPase
MNAMPQATAEYSLPSQRIGLELAIASVTARLEALAAGHTLPLFVTPPESALPSLQRIFGLDRSELELLSLVAGQEIDVGLGSAIHALSGTAQATPALLKSLLGEHAWSVLAPAAPLRRWRLIELSGSGPLRGRGLAIDERILNFLLGDPAADGRLDGLVRILGPGDTPAAGMADAVARIQDAWSDNEQLPVILFSGRDQAPICDVLFQACAHLGCAVMRINADDIPTNWDERHALAIFLDRELALSRAMLLIECRDQAQSVAAARLTDALAGAVAISAPEPALPEREPRLRIDLPETDRSERRALWQAALGERAAGLSTDLDRISEQFSLARSDIRTAAADAIRQTAVAQSAHGGSKDAGIDTGIGMGAALWQAARNQARGPLDGLAQRVESNVGWDDLVLAAEPLATLHDLSEHLQQAWTVRQDWGWAEQGGRGLGTAALFAGASGTGKTLAAEIIANELRLDLYRIDLSQVISKYIGETEKNLSRIFSAAENSGAMLLFDEADALFGKRSEVKDSHDRYANVEVSYLLQRMEAYSGLAILTSNQKSAVDKAFLRRLRYVINFPFPDAAARARIWARIFPPKTPTAGLDPARLARLNIAGGSIRSIALNAAFLAAADGGPVRMEHLLRATRREYAKLEKPFTSSELGAFR